MFRRTISPFSLLFQKHSKDLHMNNGTTLKALGICGSLRQDSYNNRLLAIAMEMAAGEGAIVEQLDPKSLQLPVFDHDLTSDGSVPASVEVVFTAFRAADMLLIASPEYNHSIPGGLKNLLDWVSTDRPSFQNKTAAIFGASTGLYGTIRMQPHLRIVLGALDIITLPQPQVFLRSAASAFSPEGSMMEKKTEAQLRSLIRRTISLTRQVKESEKAPASG